MRLLSDLWGELTEKYTEHIKKQALLKAMPLRYSIDPHKARLDKIERLAWIVLQFPELKEYLKPPGPGADDHGERALAWLNSQAYLYYDYVLEKPGAADKLKPEERQAADKAFVFSIGATFTPDESAEKERASSPTRPFQAGLLGDALKQIELSGHTDPAKGSLVHWWLVETLHPSELAISAGEQTSQTHVYYWLRKGAESKDILVRVRTLGGSAADYTIKCTDTIIKQGDAVRVFANQWPLAGGFPY